MGSTAETLGIELFVSDKSAAQNLRKVGDGFVKLDSLSKNTVQVSQFAMAKAVAMGNLLSSGIQSLFGKMFSAIPALGETLSQAGSVFFRNLFKPLQDVLLPMLRSLMNWVRDNRAGFVILGSVIAGVFQLIATVVKAVFGFISKMFEAVFGSLTGGAKASFQNVAQFLNMLLLKIAFAIQFALILLEPVFDLIVAGVVMVMNKFKEMFDFIVAFINDPVKALEDFGVVTIGLVIAGVIALGTAIWSAVVPAIWGMVTAMASFMIAALPLVLIGVVIGAIAKGVIWVVKNFDKLWAGIKSGASYAWGKIKEFAQGMKDFFGGIVDWVVNKFNAIIDWFKSLPKKIKDAFVSAWESVKEFGQKVNDMFTNKDVIELLKKKQEEDARAAAAASGSAASVSNSSSQKNNVTVNLNGDQSNPEVARQNGKMVADGVTDSLVKQKGMAGR